MFYRLKASRTADYLAACVIILMAIGTVFVFSAGANVTTNYNWNRFYSFTTLRQLIFFPLAAIVMYSLSLIDYHKLTLKRRRQYQSPVSLLLALSIALLILVLIPRFGTEVNYARRWFRLPLGPITLSFQPSELAKWSVMIFLAAVLDVSADSIKLFWKRFVPVCLVVGLVIGLIVKEDFGTAAFLTLLAFLILLIGGARWWHFLAPLHLIAPAFYLAIVTSPNRLQRLTAFFHPGKLADTVAYQANQSLIAISTGGMLGKGLGRGICKYGHLPEDTTDFIFAIIAEELGMVGTFAVIGLFIAFAVLGIIVITRSKDRLGQLLAAAIVLTITIQAAINIGVATVVLPTKGIPLPFVSAGGTSMLLSAAAVGILMNIAKQNQTETLEERL